MGARARRPRHRARWSAVALRARDTTEKLEAFLDAVRWGAATNADRGYLQAPFRSGVSIEDYQLDPLVRAIDMARTNLLIADDVGLGKTIEAGLVVQEMLLRHRARTILVCCPSSLQEKWRIEMVEKFGLEFRIVDTEYVKRLRRERGLHANPVDLVPSAHHFRSTGSKQGEGIRLLRDTLPVHATLPEALRPAHRRRSSQRRADGRQVCRREPSAPVSCDFWRRTSNTSSS